MTKILLAEAIHIAEAEGLEGICFNDTPTNRYNLQVLGFSRWENESDKDTILAIGSDEFQMGSYMCLEEHSRKHYITLLDIGTDIGDTTEEHC